MMHEATSPAKPAHHAGLSPSDALLARSAAAWKLPDPPPPINRQGGVEPKQGPPSLSPYPQSQVEINAT